MSGSQYNAAMFRTCMEMVKEGFVNRISLDHRLIDYLQRDCASRNAVRAAGLQIVLKLS